MLVKRLNQFMVAVAGIAQAELVRGRFVAKCGKDNSFLSEYCCS